MSRHAILYNEPLFYNMMTPYMHRVEGAADLQVRFDNCYMADLDEWLWYSHTACRARIDRLYVEFLVPPLELEITIKYRDIHRWCLSMLHTVITSHTRSTGGV